MFRYISSTGFPGGSEAKNSPVNAGDMGSIPGSGGSPEEENGNPLQYSCLGYPLDRGAWWATVHGVAILDKGFRSNITKKKGRDGEIGKHKQHEMGVLNMK